MLKTILTSLALFVSCNATHASTYYISSTTGDDSRTATQAKSQSTPWKSISKLNSYFATLQPGDSVLFERGGVYKGAITVNKSGTSSAPITIGAYGSGNKPVISRLATVGGWTSMGNGIWESAAISTSVTNMNIVLFDGQIRGMGRYPNANASNKGYLTVDSHSGTNSVTCSQLPSSINFGGGEIVVRTCHWVLDRSKIKSQSGTTLSIAGVSTPANGFGFFIQNSIKTLDQLGEWYYNPSTKKLSVYFGSESPSNHLVEASTGENVVYNYNFDYINIQDLEFEGGNHNGIYIYSSTHSNIRNCDINYSGMYGLYLAQDSYFLLENCNFNDSLNNCIEAITSDSYLTFRKNRFINTGMIAGMGQNGPHTYEAIRMNATHSLIEYNVFDHVGFCGIRFTGDYNTIQYNLVDYFDLVKDDGGGIYTGCTSSSSVATGRVIRNNIVLHGIGTCEGTTASTRVQADGIYMDDAANGVTIEGNTVAFCGHYGLYLHNAHNIKVTGNTLFNNCDQAWFKHDSSSWPTINNLVMTNNVFFSKLASQKSARFYTCNNDISNFGVIDYNYYVRPLDDTYVMEGITYLSSSSQVTTQYTLGTWQSKYGKDTHSHKSPATFSSSTNPDDVILFAYNETTNDKVVPLSSGYMDAKGTKYSGSVTLAPFTSIVLMKDSSSGSGGSIPVISSASTATATVGTAFSYQITASYSPTSFGATGLPSGLTVNTTTGLISGTPSASGVFNVTLSAKNTYGTGTKTLQLTVNAAPQPPVITSPTSASATVGKVFNYQITASNSPTSYSASGLPAGISVNTSTGLISGTPTTAGSYAVSISASNSAGKGSATLTITVNPQPSPVITSATSATTMVSSAFTYQITASNSPTSYNATGLPAGLSVNTSTGSITGAPTLSGVYPVTISATNPGGTGSATLTITVNDLPAAPVITSALSANGEAGVSFSYQITANNNPTSYGASGLPSGLIISSSTGKISGTPTTAGTYSVTITATNAGGTGSATLSMTISPTTLKAPVITSPTSASGKRNRSFTYQITASNSPNSYNATGLPSGLTLNKSTGLISGTPNVVGTFNVTVSASNIAGTGSQVVTMTMAKH